MPARRRRPERPAWASGPNIPEASRSTVALKLRVRPEVRERLEELAAERESTLSDVVSELVEREAKAG